MKHKKKNSKTLPSYGTGWQQPDEDDQPLGLLEMIQSVGQPCDNPDCIGNSSGCRSLGSSCHFAAGSLVSITDGVFKMRCRACGGEVLSCYVEQVDFPEQTCHPRGGCDVFFVGSTGRLSACCHLCRSPVGSAVVMEVPQKSRRSSDGGATISPDAAGASPEGRRWREAGIDLSQLRLAADPNREMTAEERCYYTGLVPCLDLPLAIVVPTRGGGSLKLSAGEGIVTLVTTGDGPACFAMTFPQTDFRRTLLAGGRWDCPGVGQLVAGPGGPGLIRLCLVPQHGKGKLEAGFSFAVELSIDEVLERL